MDDFVFIGNNVLVKWDSEVGPHSGDFSIDWLKKHDYTSPGLLQAKKKLEEPLIAVNANMMQMCITISQKNIDLHLIGAHSTTEGASLWVC